MKDLESRKGRGALSTIPCVPVSSLKYQGGRGSGDPYRPLYSIVFEQDGDGSLPSPVFDLM